MALLEIRRTDIEVVVLAWIGAASALGNTLFLGARFFPSLWELTAVGFVIVLATAVIARRPLIFPLTYAAMWLPFAVMVTWPSGSWTGLFLPQIWGPFLLGLPLAIARAAEARRVLRPESE